MKRNSVLRDKSYDFAVRIVRYCQFLQKDKKEFILTKQLLRSGTAIGALIREAEYAQSRADYINKFYVSLKEANEIAYWLLLLKDTGYMDETMYDPLSSDCNGLISILVSSIKTLKNVSN
jgi:four helix bundle protein